jgi:hypothetical protein
MAGDAPKLQKLVLENRPTYIQDYEQWTRLVQDIFVRGQGAR